MGLGCGSTLQHTATHCNTLQHTATHCNTYIRHSMTLHYSEWSKQGSQSASFARMTPTCVCVLQCVAVCCSVLQQCVAVCCFACVNYTDMYLSVLYADCSNTLQQTAIHCNTKMRHSALPVRMTSTCVCVAVCVCVLQYVAVCCGVLQCVAVCCSDMCVCSVHMTPTCVCVCVWQ